MQTVLFREINGYKIIIGYRKLSIDLIETQKTIKKLMAKDEDVKRIKDLNRQINILNKQIQEIRKKGYIKDRQEEKQFNNYLEQKKDCLEEISNLEKNNKIKIDKLIIEKAVYFEPAKNEIIKTDKEIETLKGISNNLKKRQLMDIDGKIIDNWTGINYFLKKDKWIAYECLLGEVPKIGSKIYQDLTDEEKNEIGEQNEKDRIDLLGPKEKKNEKKIAIDSAAIIAANKKASLEIQGIKSTKAFNEAQKWYKEQVEIIEKKYE